jgi:hypothetical protein
MRKFQALWIVVCALPVSSSAQQRIFDWTKASDEAVQLDPADFRTGRVYDPEPEDGNLHVGIEARQPVTIAMAWSDEWTAARPASRNGRH